MNLVALGISYYKIMSSKVKFDYQKLQNIIVTEKQNIFSNRKELFKEKNI